VAYPVGKFQPVPKTVQPKNGCSVTPGMFGNQARPGLSSLSTGRNRNASLTLRIESTRASDRATHALWRRRRDSVATSTARTAVAAARLRCDGGSSAMLLPPTSIPSGLRLPPSLRYPVPFSIDVLGFLDCVCVRSSSIGLGAWRTMRTLHLINCGCGFRSCLSFTCRTALVLCLLPNHNTSILDLGGTFLAWFLMGGTFLAWFLMVHLV
jgi:hypothetical protein